MNRSVKVAILAILGVALGASAALALEQTNGSGLTHEGASLGFNTKLDLRGNITYTSHDGTMFQVMCRDGLTRYQNQKPSRQGFLRTRVTATCTDKNGDTIYATPRSTSWTAVSPVSETWSASFHLRPGVRTRRQRRSRRVPHEVQLWVEVTEGCNDVGVISRGNVQIHHQVTS